MSLECSANNKIKVWRCCGGVQHAEEVHGDTRALQVSEGFGVSGGEWTRRLVSWRADARKKVWAKNWQAKEGSSSPPLQTAWRRVRNIVCRFPHWCCLTRRVTPVLCVSLKIHCFYTHVLAIFLYFPVFYLISINRSIFLEHKSIINNDNYLNYKSIDFLSIL